MNKYKEDYLNYRISKSEESLNDTKLLAANGSWNACVNRLNYACYYMVSSLTLKSELTSQTHSGLKSLFNLNFIKPGLVPIEFGKLYSDLMDWRQKGDYGDMFDFDKETVEPLIEQVERFINYKRYSH